MKNSKQIAYYLLKIRAFKFNTVDLYTWSSGIKSPIYCDNRLICSDVTTRELIINSFCELILQNYSQIDAIAGVKTGGISYGALIADRLRLPFFYVKETIEGTYNINDRVVLIEDHISKGESSMIGIKTLRQEKMELIALLSVTTYGFKQAINLFKQESVKHESLCDLETILKVAIEENRLSKSEIKKIIEFINANG